MVPSALIPIRVDVVSDDKSIRIVETLLFDPTCWPVPLSAPLHESLEKNVRQLAHTLLSDLEVQGMGRTVRHFTGRVDLYSSSLQTKIEGQLRPQLWDLAVSTPIPNAKPTTIPIRLLVHGVSIQEDVVWDPSVPFSPLEFAKDMGYELKLSEEAVVAIATTIIEQLYGLSVDTSLDPSATKPWMGASMLEQKESVANVAHLVAQHKPAEEIKSIPTEKLQ
jgi:hypothetical protein